jgi:hypothetical protein
VKVFKNIIKAKEAITSKVLALGAEETRSTKLFVSLTKYGRSLYGLHHLRSSLRTQYSKEQRLHPHQFGYALHSDNRRRISFRPRFDPCEPLLRWPQLPALFDYLKQQLRFLL